LREVLERRNEKATVKWPIRFWVLDFPGGLIVHYLRH
jgi:hypothetical protein